MSFRLSSLRSWLAGAAAVALSGVLLGSLQAGEKQSGRPIEFSEPKSGEVTTNLHQLTSKKDGLRQLEEDLYRPLQLFAPKSSLEGVVAPPRHPPARSVIQNQRVKDLLERRKNWVFMTPEDLLSAPTVEDILKGSDVGGNSAEKRLLAPMDRYYQGLATKRSRGNAPDQLGGENLFGAPGKPNSHDQPGSHDDSNLPSGLRATAQALREFTRSEAGDDPFGLGTTHNRFSDTFGLEDGAPTQEQMHDHKKLMDEHHTLVDPSWRPPAAANAVNPLAGFAEAARPAANAAPGLGGSPSPALHKGVEAQLDVINPMLGPARLPDLNAQALGQPRSALALPLAEPPKVVAPTFTAPKRSF